MHRRPPSSASARRSVGGTPFDALLQVGRTMCLLPPMRLVAMQFPTENRFALFLELL